MRKYKPLIGVILIVTALAGIFLWEVKGRDAVVTETVLVASAPVEKGMVLETEMVKIISVMKGTKVPGAYGAEQKKLLSDKRLARTIQLNEQITDDMFQGEVRLPKGTSIYQIKPQWIDSRSSSLRKGDLVAVYGADGEPFLGNYRVAFVKDQYEQEVESADLIPGDSTLDRVHSTSQVSHIEIVASLAEYEVLKSFASQLEGPSLLLVQVDAEGEE